MDLRRKVLILLALCLGCSGTLKDHGPAIPVGPVEDLLTYDTPPTLVTPAKLDYPDIARDVGAEGRVVLKVLVLEDGTVGAIQVLESPHPVLTDNAVKAVRTCLFAPAVWKGAPVKATVVMPFIFSLNRSFQRTSVSSEPEETVPSTTGAVPPEPPQPPQPPAEKPKYK